MIQIRSICLSAHLDSFCRELGRRLGDDFEFVYLDYPGEMRQKIGWRSEASYRNTYDDEEARKRSCDCEVLIVMEREFDIIEKRLKSGKTTFYMAERWLKPIRIHLPFRVSIVLPGILRMLSPRYCRMTRRFASFMDDPNFHIFPIGIHAARDLIRLQRLVHGDMLYFFKTPNIKVERKLGGTIEGYPRMRLWAYFVEPSSLGKPGRNETPVGGLKILWCGRMIDWKRVDVLITAVKRLRSEQDVRARNAELLLIGEGPELAKLQRIAKGCDFVRFEGYKKQDEVRELMRKADVYVMPSNAEEGWGAAVADASSEGCPVISTWEAGSSATLLPEENLYHASSVTELTQKLLEVCKHGAKCLEMSDWSGMKAAEIFLDIL